MYTNNKKVIKTFADFLRTNFNHVEISNCREVKPNYYALSKLYMYKNDRLCDLVELGISNVTEKNCDIKFEKLLDNTLNYMGVWQIMTYKYEIKYDAYSAIDEKFVTKIELGDSKIFENNERIKDIITECNATVDKQEWQSKYNKYVSYDYQPKGEGYLTQYSLSFNNEYQRNYFFYLLDKYYLDLNYYETIYELEPCVQAGSKEDR